MSTKSRVILISGFPGNGKSTLGRALRDQHGFSLVEIDTVYVEFIQNHRGDVYLPRLGEVIYQHYNAIFSQDHQAVRAWAQHLFTRIAQESGHVVAEGYLLKDCKVQIAAGLTAQGRQVFHVDMRQDKVPVLETPLADVAAVAALGVG